MAGQPQRPTAAPTTPANSLGDLSLPQRTTPALVMSLFLHVILLITIALVVSRQPAGSGESEDRPVGIAVVHRMPDRDRFVDAATLPENKPSQTEPAADPAAASAAAAPPADFAPPIDLDGILQAMESVPSPVAGTGLAGETKLDGDAFDNARTSVSATDSGKTTTTVFGVSGSGSRFVYVFDRSDSMNGYDGRPLRAAKTELRRSLKTLTERQRFQIIFYNEKPTPYRLAGAPVQMILGEPSLVSRAERYVDSIAAFGGTEHASALKVALRLSPDVIFFLTDARIPRLSGLELRDIQRQAEQVGTTIHAIEFGAEPAAPADSFLRDLASMNQGQYQYIDVRRLGVGATFQDAPDANP